MTNAYPNASLAPLRDYIAKSTKSSELMKPVDLLISQWVKEKDGRMVQTVPSLSQHIEVYSSLKNRGKEGNIDRIYFDSSIMPCQG